MMMAKTTNNNSISISTNKKYEWMIAALFPD